MNDYLKDLLPEYEAMIPELQERFYFLNPNGTVEAAKRYIQCQILRRARKLVNYSQLAELVASNDVNVSSLLLTHKSWIERGVAPDYYQSIDGYLKKSLTFLDIGCGVNPLYVLSYYKQIEEYVCVEPDKRVLQVLKKVCPRVLSCRFEFYDLKIEDLSEVFKKRKFDFVFVQKLLPLLIKKYQQASLKAIASLDFCHAFLTCSLNSLSRTCSIADDEIQKLDLFCDRMNFLKVKEFNGINEFGYIVRKALK